MSSATAARTSAANTLAPPRFAPPAQQARRFGAHQQRELEPRHVLYGGAVTPVAAGADADVVVFALGVGDGVAMVHLTYAKRPALSADWPATTIFASLEQALDTADR